MTELAATATAVPIVTTTETVAVTSPLPDARRPAGAGIVIRGTVNLVPAGTGTTAVVLKVRQGTTNSGTQVGVSQTVQVGTTPGLDATPEIAVIDYNPAQPLGQYVVTVTQTGASGNGTIQQATIEVILPTESP